MLEQRYELIGFGLVSCFIGLTVVLGAVGSHIVAGHFPESLDSYRLAVHYAQLHGIALSLLFITAHKIHRLIFLLTCGCFIAGLCGFSGLLVLKAFELVTPSAFAIPVGGSCFIAGWFIWGAGMISAAWRS